MSSGSGRPHRSRSTRNSGWDEAFDRSWPRPLNASHPHWDDLWPRPGDVPRHGRSDAPTRSEANAAWLDRGGDDIPYQGDSTPEHSRNAEHEDECDRRLDWLARHVAVNLTLLFDEPDYDVGDLERLWHGVVEDAVNDAETPISGLDDFLDYMTRRYGIERDMVRRWVTLYLEVQQMFTDLGIYDQYRLFQARRRPETGGRG